MLINFSKGLTTVCGVGICFAIVLSWFYHGDKDKQMVLQTMTIITILLEFTDFWRARVNGIFPAYLVLAPAAMAVTFYSSGWIPLIIFTIVLLGLVLTLHKKKKAQQVV